jgi:hypothetical protein
MPKSLQIKINKLTILKPLKKQAKLTNFQMVAAREDLFLKYYLKNALI